MVSRALKYIGIAIAGMGMTVGATAQQLPTTAEPGAVIAPFAEETPTPRAQPGGIEGATPEAQFGPEAEAVRFVVSDVVVQGSTVYSDAELADLIGPIEGREASLAEIDSLAQQLTARYRGDGYILSQVVLPEQEIIGGVVRLVAVEGYIADVAFEGEIRGPQDILDAHAARIMADQPLRAATLERALLLIGDLSGGQGVNVSTVLSASPTTPGAAVLTIEIEQELYEVFGSIDNYGASLVGDYQATLGVSFFSALEQFERVDLIGVTALEDDDLFYGEARVTWPTGTAGDYVRFSVSASNSTPNVLGDPESDTLELRAFYFRPYIRSREENLTFRVGAVWRDQETDTDFFGPNTVLIDDSLRMLRAGLQYDFVDSALGVNLFDIEVTQGFDAFGASQNGQPNLSRQNGRAEFTSVQVFASRNQSLVDVVGDGWTVYGEFRGQLASHALLASEEFSVGGPNSARGYDPGTLSGDNGLSLRGELRYGEFLEGRDWLTSYQVYGFVDYGMVGNIDADTSSFDSITSAGAGLRLNINDNLSANLEVAHRFRDVQDGNDDTRFLFSLNVRLP